MSITRPKPKAVSSIEEFIDGAPDGSRKVPGVVRGNKQQISLTIAPELLLQVEEMAAEMGQTRAGLINMAVYRLIQQMRTPK